MLQLAAHKLLTFKGIFSLLSSLKAKHVHQFAVKVSRFEKLKFADFETETL